MTDAAINHRRGLLAALATLIPYGGCGIGHILAHRANRGWAWLAAFLATLALGGLWFWAFFLWPLVCLGAAVDAMSSP